MIADLTPVIFGTWHANDLAAAFYGVPIFCRGARSIS
jgi:hypothetical protein